MSRPVPSPSQGAPPSRWPEDSRRLAEDLQRRLTIDGRDWHALKGQKPRRAAEQIAAALVQLLGDDSPPHRRGGEAQQRAIDLLEHGLGWLKGERSDPGCPSHGGGGQGAG